MAGAHPLSLVVTELEEVLLVPSTLTLVCRLRGDHSTQAGSQSGTPGRAACLQTHAHTQSLTLLDFVFLQSEFFS